MRKRRSDRNHIIYQIRNKQTEEFYIGITALIGKAYLCTIKKRWKQHLSRAKTQNLEWSICENIRKYGELNFEISIIEVIRGKSEAHAREMELIKERKPHLNTTANKRIIVNNFIA
jgi:hypothetical protein